MGKEKRFEVIRGGKKGKREKSEANLEILEGGRETPGEKYEIVLAPIGQTYRNIIKHPEGKDKITFQIKKGENSRTVEIDTSLGSLQIKELEEDRFELKPIAEINWGDPRLKVADMETRMDRVWAKIFYGMAEFQSARRTS